MTCAGRQRRREQRDVFSVADCQDVGRRCQALGDDEGGRLAGDQFCSLVGARGVRQALIVLGFLMAEDLDTAGMDQVKVTDLVGGRCGVAGDQAFAAGEAGKPAQLQRFAIFFIQLLYR